MKKYVILVLILATASAALAFCLVCCEWNDAMPPPRPLPEAYGMAVTALGPATNLFHCVGAKCSNNTGAFGDWKFTFCDTNAHYKTVYVEMLQVSYTEGGQQKLAPLTQVFDGKRCPDQ